MFVSVRKRFRKGDERWDDYYDPTYMPPLNEVRSVDGLLSRYAAGAHNIECTLDTLAEALEDLPIPEPGNEYYLLAVNLTKDPPGPVPEEWKLLGHDLTDETHVSTLLNCGPWEGQLEPFMARANDVGLLSRADAEMAREILFAEYGEWDHHARTDVWALYERKQPASG